MPTPHPLDIDADGNYCDTCGLPPQHPAHRAVDTNARVLAPVNAPDARVGLHAPATSHQAASGALPRSGTVKAQVFTVIAKRSQGATDDEIEQILDRSHQSVSAARNALAAAGWIQPMLDGTGRHVTRRTRSGHDAYAWTTTAAARAQMPPIGATA